MIFAAYNQTYHKVKIYGQKIVWLYRWFKIINDDLSNLKLTERKIEDHFVRDFDKLITK
jgi:hypothetical protein